MASRPLIRPVTKEITESPHVSDSGSLPPSPPPQLDSAPVLSQKSDYIGDTLIATHAAWQYVSIVTRSWWRTNGIDPAVKISGETGLSYVLKAADNGFKVYYREDVAGLGGTAHANSDSTNNVRYQPPVCAVPPELLSTSFHVDETVVVAPGEWENATAVVGSWWRTDGGAVYERIIGETGTSYVLKDADVGMMVYYREDATGPGGTNYEESSLTDEVQPASTPVPTLVTAPELVGPVNRVGAILFTSGGVWNNTATIVKSWWRVGGATPTQIPGAAGSSYTLTNADLGYQVFYREDATGPGGTAYAETASSAMVTNIPAYSSIAGFGDSITVGANATDPRSVNGWLGQVGSFISASVLNAGISGTVLQNSNDSTGSPRANNGRNRFPSAILNANLKNAVFIAYGFNDARYIGAPATFNSVEYLNDYQEMLNGLILGGYAREDIYILTPYYITDAGLASGSSGFAGQSRAGFEAHVTAAKAAAEEFGTKFIPAYSWLRDNGYAATIDTDNIHPKDAGHALIKKCVLTQSFIPNTLAQVASVSGTTGVGKVDASCATVTDATGYQFVLFQNYVNGPIQVNTSPSYSFTGLAAGTYYLKARPVFAGGTAGPWKILTTPLNVTTSADVTPPTITSPTRYSQPENIPFTATLTADEPVTWSIVGGSDAAWFSLSGAVLSMTAKDYEAPVDAYFNNSYVVFVRATDTSGNWSEQGIVVDITDVNELPAGMFFEDNFTGTDGTTLSTHLSDDGQSYMLQNGAYSANAFPIIANNRIYNGSTNGVIRVTGTAPTANYWVEADVDLLSAMTTTQGVSVTGRAVVNLNTLYFFGYTNGSGWRLFKTVGSSNTQIGTVVSGSASAAPVVGQGYTIRLEMSGTSIVGTATDRTTGNMVCQIAATDAAIAAAGNLGLRMSVLQSSTTSLHVTALRAGQV